MRRAFVKSIGKALFASLLVVSPAGLAWGIDEDDAKESSVGQGPWVTSIAVFPDSSKVFAAVADGLLLRPGHISVSPITAVNDLKNVFETDTSVWCVLPSAEAGVLVASDYKGGLWTADLAAATSGEAGAKRHDLGLRWCRALAAAPEKQMLVGTEDGKLAVVQLPEMQVARQVDGHASAIFEIAFNEERSRLATCGGDGTVKLWSWPELKEIATISMGSEAIWTSAFSTDGQYLVAGGADRRVCLIDVEAGKSLMTMRIVPDWVTSIDVMKSPNGASDLFAIGCMNGQVILFDLASRRQVSRLDGPGSAIWDIAFSGDGESLIVATRKHGLAALPASSWAESLTTLRERAIAELPPAPSVE